MMKKSVWKIDPLHSSINFRVKHMMISKIHGCFDRFSGTWLLDLEDPTTSSIEAFIDADSINTYDKTRDRYLKGPQFLNAEKYPSLIFKSARIEFTAKGEFKVAGDFTLHGVTQSITLQVRVPLLEMPDKLDDKKISISATTQINRKDFNLTWNSSLEIGNIMVGEIVAVLLDIQWIKQEE